jgi:hypothetical protein
MSELAPEDDGRNIEIPINWTAEQDAYSLSRLEKIAAELSGRETEALRVYRPSKIQTQYHACRAKECVFVAGNQVGKSIAGYMEDGYAVTGTDPYDKYPKENGIGAIVVYKESQIKLNVYRYLLKPGAIDIIRDTDTGLWRPYYPWMPADADRKSERKPAPPIIPRRLITRIHWKSKTGNVFTRIDLETGWELHVFSSTAKPDAGFQADFVHIDEDIANAEWYTEMIARLSIRSGYMRWTALPLFSNDTLPRIVERGDDEAEKHDRGGPVPTTTVVRATIFDNPYLTEETRQENIKRWTDEGEDVVRQRAYGELITDTVRMYPTFSASVHAVQRYAEQYPQLFGEYLRTGETPDDWCLRLIIDPGFSICAGLFVATLPGPIQVNVIVDELYIQQSTAAILADRVERKLRGGRWLQSLIMDAHGGRLTSSATGERPQEVYEAEFLKKGIECVETKHRFRAGCDSIEYREEVMRDYLAIQPTTGMPRLLYDERTCPNFQKEMIRFRKLRIGNIVIDKGNRRGFTHLVECGEYAVADKLEYHKPPSRRIEETPGQRRVRLNRERKAAKKRKRSGDGGSIGGGIIL